MYREVLTPLFVQQKMRKSLLSREEIMVHLEKEYHPGEEAAGQ
jgi:hypothetical protein